MRNFFLALVFIFSFGANAQIFEPIEWNTNVEKISGTEYQLISKASIKRGWHLYSQNVPKDGPIPTSFTYDNPNRTFKLIGSTLEENGHTVYDSIFQMRIKFFEKSVVFVQKIEIAESVKTINGIVEYMACDDSRCLPPTEVMLVFNLNGPSIKNSKISNVEISSSQPIINYTKTDNYLYGLTKENLHYPTLRCDAETKDSIIKGIFGKKSIWNIFGLGILGGFLALLTPCVFPMIPLTVSFFTKKEGGKSTSSSISRALQYGFFIIAVYVLLSVPFHVLDSVNPDILNDISTNVWLNVIFFIIFVVFAFSFFGYFELTLPSSWTDKTTQGENAGGFLGVFFMALTLAVVSFSCTGPILGSLLAGSLTSEGGAWQLTVGMTGFGIALGLPFGLFAMFPNVMNALPKSGGWLNTVKVVLGFLELALAFKFLSNADLVQHWNILKIEPFLVIWIIIFVGLALYLFGKIKFPHDLSVEKLSLSRISFGILVVAFTIYLASGFRMNKETNTLTPLTLLSGLAPPVGYSFLYPNQCPNNLDCFKDLKEGIDFAKKANKPIMIDFTGYACVNCRKMEEHVWPLKEIDDYLRNDYVLISLYVDDKKELPENEQIFVTTINGSKRKLKNYGHKWAHFQTQFFQTNTQPFYVLLNPDGTQILNEAVGYDPDAEDFTKFLKCGLEVFDKLKNQN